MGFWAGISIGVLVGVIIGFFMCAWFASGHMEDLYKEIARLEERPRG